METHSIHGLVAFVSNLSLKELSKVLELLRNRGCKNSNNSSVFIVSQNHILVSSSPLSPTFEENLIQKHSKPSTITGDIETRLNADRKIVLIKRGRQIVLLENTEEILIVEAKVKRNILSKQIELRRLESKSLIRLLENTDFIRPVRRSESRIQESGASNVHHVSQRTVKAVKCDQAPSVVWLAPGGHKEFTNPSHPQADKSPVQVTDIEEDSPSISAASMATSTQYRYSRGGSSIPPTSYSFSGSGMTHDSTSYSSSGASNYFSGHSSSKASVQTDAISTKSASTPRYVNYMKNEIRLASFDSSIWMVNEKPDKHTLAEQGFFFTGRDDLVRCFDCGIGLKDWIKGDDVMTEHRKYSPKCPYLLLMIQATGASTSIDAKVRAGNQTTYKVRSPQYQTMEARVSTFERFPSNINISAQQLAVAGLFFTGQGDLCRCFTCDGGLKDWSSGDDPCKEHATYFPNCTYINQLKGAEYVRDMQRRKENKMQLTSGSSGSTNQTSTTRSSTNQTSTSRSSINQTSAAASFTSSQATGNLSIPSMDLPSFSSSLNCSTIDNQVKEMGFPDSLVENARAELRRRGINNPTVEALMNAILDMPETTNANQETSNARQETPTASPCTSTTRQDTQSSRQANTNTTVGGGDIPSGDIQALAEENERLSRQIQCMLCVTEEPEVLFLPCAHHRVCYKCSESTSRCPQCNKVIKEKIRTYRA